MIAYKYHKMMLSFFMALFMSGIMSFVISVFNIGFVDNIIFIWLKAWGFAFIIAFPTIVVISPFVNKLVSLIVCQSPKDL